MPSATQPLFRTRDRRRWMTGGTGQLFEPAAPYATNNRNRRRPPKTDTDTRGNLTDMGWRELLTWSRYLYGNSGPIRSAMRQMVDYAVGEAFQIQYIGKDRAWGDKMEEAVYQADKICDVRGGSFDFNTGLKLDLLSIIRDADCNCVLTETETGWPQFQSIPSHRIANVGEIQDDTVMDGSFTGRAIQNGVIMNEAGRAIAYRVALGPDAHVDVPAGSMFQDYRPEFYDQARGIPWVAAGIYDAADIADIRGFTKTALKTEASITLIEHNEMGEPMDQGSALFGGSVTRNDDNSLATSPAVEYLDDSTLRYFRAGTGSKIEAPNSQRPSIQSQQFSFEILRSAFEGMGWPIEFYDPSALGGANIRLRVAQAKRTIEALQHIAKRIATRKHTYVVAKLIKLGVLAPVDDWWKIEHKAPRDLTVDNGRDTKADLEMYRIGAMTLDELCARNGNYWEEVQDQKIREAKRLNERCAEEDVDTQQVQMLTPNGNEGAGADAEDADAPDGESMQADRNKAEADAYGVAVRAGAITPARSDEDYFRAKMGLPPASGEVSSAWTKDGGVRRPITLAQPGGASPMAAPPQVKDEE